MKKAALLLLCAMTLGRGWAQPAAATGQAQPGTSAAKSPETLLWADEFNSPTSQSQPNPANWTYDTGADGWGNAELETYCAWASSIAPCDATHPNAFVGTDGYLHIVARDLGKDVYTSARLKSQGLQSFRYGRIEARIKIAEGQGIWPAFWMLGDNITTVDWPACGEIDIMENIGKLPSIAYGSIHAPEVNLTKSYTLPNGEKLASAFHIYGVIWSPGRMEFYVDSPDNIFATYTLDGLPKNASWPFDKGKFFLILNLAVGGKWPGNPDATTKFPQEMLVDYVRVYAVPEPAAP